MSEIRFRPATFDDIRLLFDWTKTIACLAITMLALTPACSPTSPPGHGSPVPYSADDVRGDAEIQPGSGLADGRTIPPLDLLNVTLAETKSSLLITILHAGRPPVPGRNEFGVYEIEWAIQLIEAEAGRDSGNPTDLYQIRFGTAIGREFAFTDGTAGKMDLRPVRIDDALITVEVPFRALAGLDVFEFRWVVKLHAEFQVLSPHVGLLDDVLTPVVSA